MTFTQERAFIARAYAALSRAAIRIREARADRCARYCAYVLLSSDSVALLRCYAVQPAAHSNADARAEEMITRARRTMRSVLRYHVISLSVWGVGAGTRVTSGRRLSVWWCAGVRVSTLPQQTDISKSGRVAGVSLPRKGAAVRQRVCGGSVAAVGCGMW